MSKTCQTLHQLADGCVRHRFPYENDLIPSDGIYLLFELSERGHGCDRIVRIGTHTGLKQLPSRLKQHFINENKDRSIFRKNIGRALLAKNNDPFLDKWNLDLTTRRARELYAKRIDEQKQRQVEKEVSKRIQDSFSFIVLPISNKDERLRLESRIISTVSWCNECQPSVNWLGQYSPKEKIRRSGLWLVNELYKEPLSAEDKECLELLVTT